MRTSPGPDPHRPPGPRFAGRGQAATAGSLLGRDTELARLAGLLDVDAPVLITGEAGIGKTSLARAAAAATGRRLLEGGGFATLAWAPFLALERAVRRPLPPGDPSRVARAVAAATGSGILFVDDLQWTDRGTRAVVGELAGRIGLVVAIRTGDPGTEEAVAMLPTGMVRLELGPLAGPDVVALARRHRPDLDATSARRVLRLTGGNPLLVEELTGADDDHASLGSVIRRRMGALDPLSREALVMLGLAGRPMHAASLGPGADGLVTAGLAASGDDGRLVLRHELIGAAAAEAVTADTRRQLEARLARLAETPGDAARHYAAAGERRTAHARALEAADAAEAPGEKAAHLALAARMADGDEAVRLRVRAAGILADANEPDAALELVADLDGADAARPAHAAVLARAHLGTYQVHEARAAARRGLESLSSWDDATVADEIALRVLLAEIAVLALDPADEALGLARAADDLARRHGIGTTPALAALGNARFLAGDQGGLDDSMAAVSRATAEGDTVMALSAGRPLVFNLLKAGRPLDGRRLAEDLAQLARAAGQDHWYRKMHGWAVGFAWHAGDFAGAVATGDGLDAEELGTETTEWYVAQALSDLGRHDEARMHAERLRRDAGPGEYDIGEVLWLSADVAFAAGRYADAILAADEHAAAVPGAHHRLFIEVTRAWAVFELGRPPDWPSLEARLPIVEGAAIELEALRALAEGHPEEAARGFDAAAAAWAGRHARGELRSSWAAAESLRRAGDLAAARGRLLSLEARLEALGAVPLLGRVHRSLRLTGLRRAARVVRHAGSSLTAREREILDLVGGGLRDQEIAARLGISRWAVVRAMGSATAKLGSATRAEAVVAVSRGLDAGS